MSLPKCLSHLSASLSQYYPSILLVDDQLVPIQSFKHVSDRRRFHVQVTGDVDWFCISSFPDQLINDLDIILNPRRLFPPLSLVSRGQLGEDAACVLVNVH